MTVVRWDPFRDFGFATSSAWLPPVDIYQSGDHEVVLKAELPDMSAKLTPLIVCFPDSDVG